MLNLKIPSQNMDEEENNRRTEDVKKKDHREIKEYSIRHLP